MERLFNFIYTYRAFFTFFLLEFFCAWLIIENSQYQSTKYFNSSNRFIANLNTLSQNVREYISLRSVNATLANENASLRNQLEKLNRWIAANKLDKRDTTRLKQFDYFSAKVINNSTQLYKNFITIDRGFKSGVETGMGVISGDFAIGKVKSVSDNYAVIISLLNIDFQVSSEIKRTGHFGTIQWEGIDPAIISLKYIPRHVNLVVGDSIVTSGYSTVFPSGVFIGKIKEFKLREEALFYDIKVELAQDFGKLKFVDVIKFRQKKERDSLERVTIGEPK